MPAIHQVDHDARLITTIWKGDTADLGLIYALDNYLTNYKEDTELTSYNELVDLSEIQHIKITFQELSKLAKMASRSNGVNVKTHLAIVTSSKMALTFAKMYVQYRKLTPGNKELKVFDNKLEALQWLITTNPLELK